MVRTHYFFLTGFVKISHRDVTVMLTGVEASVLIRALLCQMNLMFCVMTYCLCWFAGVLAGDS